MDNQFSRKLSELADPVFLYLYKLDALFHTQVKSQSRQAQSVSKQLLSNRGFSYDFFTIRTILNKFSLLWIIFVA